MTSDDPRSLAGEYVLGTLSAEERAAFERALAEDPGLGREVRLWEERLAPLADGIAPVAPDPVVWTRIEQAIRAPDRPADPPPDEWALARLRRSRNVWRGIALAAGALAAGLALFVAASFGPLTGSGGDYVAVVNRGGELPALIVRVDARAGVVHVRSLSAEAPPDHSLELWYVRAGEAPRSLGVVTAAAGGMPMPPGIAAPALAGASLAVSVEPKGGSPTGSPTGPVVYSGALIKDPP